MRGCNCFPDLARAGSVLSQPQECADFYRAIGIPLQDERHGDAEPLHYACDLGDVHIAVFTATEVGASPGLGEPGCAFPGFAVESVDDTVEVARQVGAAVMQEPDDYPWGRRAVLSDPDGRPVEVFTPPA